MSCCDELDSLVPPYHVTPRPTLHGVTRRVLLAGAAKLAAVSAFLAACAPARQQTPSSVPGGTAPAGGPTAPVPGPRAATLQPLEIAFCSQVLCGIPLEV